MAQRAPHDDGFAADPEMLVVAKRATIGTSPDAEGFNQMRVPDELDLGPCCACGTTQSPVHTLVCLDRRAPQPGTGWGCLVCELPPDGALACLCDACLEAKQEPIEAIHGTPAQHGRLLVAYLAPQWYGHDASKHAPPPPPPLPDWARAGGAIVGKAGRTVRVTARLPEAAKPPGASDALVDAWLLHLPGQHPFWSDYVLTTCHLRPLPQDPEPFLQAPDMSHELMLCALDPDSPPDPARPLSFAQLTPPNLVAQVALPDDAAAEAVTALLAAAFADGRAIGEPSGIEGARELNGQVVAQLVMGVTHGVLPDGRAIRDAALAARDGRRAEETEEAAPEATPEAGEGGAA